MFSGILIVRGITTESVKDRVDVSVHVVAWQKIRIIRIKKKILFNMSGLFLSVRLR